MQDLRLSRVECYPARRPPARNDADRGPWASDGEAVKGNREIRAGAWRTKTRFATTLGQEGSRRKKRRTLPGRRERLPKSGARDISGSDRRRGSRSLSRAPGSVQPEISQGRAFGVPPQAMAFPTLRRRKPLHVFLAFTTIGRRSIARVSKATGRAEEGAVKCHLGLESLEERTVPAFLAPVNLSTGATIVAAAVGDFNGDGLKDIVTVGDVSGRGMVTVELNNGDGTYKAGPSADTGNSPMDVEVGDFNGDGKEDVVTIAQYYTGGVTVIDGNGDGSFQPYTSYTVQIPPTAIEVADVNNDGHPDLVASNHYFDTTERLPQPR